MKFHKKIAITSCLLLITGAAGAVILSSCSQGATPNLTGNYEYTIGSNKYKFNNNAIQYEESAGNFTNLTKLYDEIKKHKIEDYDRGDSSTYPPADKVLKYNEGALGNLISTYLISICNQYLYLLTSDPKGAVTSGGVNNEFELAYHLGMGEAKSTYRLRVQSLSFAMTDPLPAKWEYGQEILPKPADPDKPDVQELDITNEKVSITNIKMTFGYWKSNGGSSVEDIKDLKTIQDSNWKDYWREYLKTPEFTGITPTTLKWDVSFNKTLNFEVQPTVTRFKKEGEDKFTYRSTGLVNVVGLDSKNTNDPFAWPLWFDGLEFQKDDAAAHEIVDNVEKQKSFNDLMKKYLEDYLDDKLPYESFANSRNPASVLFKSLKDSFAYAATPPAPPSSSSPTTFTSISTITTNSDSTSKRTKNASKA